MHLDNFKAFRNELEKIAINKKVLPPIQRYTFTDAFALAQKLREAATRPKGPYRRLLY